MKHYRTLLFVAATVVALVMSSTAFASSDYLLQIKDEKGGRVASVRCANGTWTVDHLPPGKFSVIVVDAAGNDVTDLIKADVKIQGFVVNSHTSPFDLAVFGFEPQPVQAATRKAYAVPHVFESPGRCSAKVTISNFSAAAVASSKHETSKNAVGNIR